MNVLFNSDGTSVSVHIQVIQDGEHVDPDSWPITNDPAIVLSSHPSATKTVTKNDVGDYLVTWSGLSPALTNGQLVNIAIDGAIGGTAWTTLRKFVQVMRFSPTADEISQRVADDWDTGDNGWHQALTKLTDEYIAFVVPTEDEISFQVWDDAGNAQPHTVDAWTYIVNTYIPSVDSIQSGLATEAQATSIINTQTSHTSSLSTIASGIVTALGNLTTLLGRITGIIRTSAEDVTAETAQTATIRSGLATVDGNGNVQANVTRWRGTVPGNVDSNGFVPSNLAAVNGNTTRASTLATALDNNLLNKLNVAGDLATVDGNGNVQANVTRWKGSVPASVDGNGLLPTGVPDIQIPQAAASRSFRTTFIGNYLPQAAISTNFVSYKNLDFTASNYIVKARRNTDPASDQVVTNLGTITVNKLPFTYTLPNNYVNGDTGEFILLDEDENTVSIKRFSVSTDIRDIKALSLVAAQEHQD